MKMASGRPALQATDTRQELAELVKRRAEIAVSYTRESPVVLSYIGRREMNTDGVL
jgi:hypothetical protein